MPTAPEVRVHHRTTGWVLPDFTNLADCTSNFHREQDGRPACTATAVWKVVEDHGLHLTLSFWCDTDLPNEHRPTAGNHTERSRMTTTDPRAQRIAEHRQRIAHETHSDSPAWTDLPEKIRTELTAEAANWLHAAVEAGIAPPAERPTPKHNAVWVDDDGFLYGEYQTIPSSHGDAILRLVWAAETCDSKRELEERGVEFRLLGWSQ